MSSTSAETAWIDLPGGVPAFTVHLPASEPRPGLLLVHDRVGVGGRRPYEEPQHLFDTAGDLALQGYVCLGVDLYHRGFTLDDTRVLQDLGLGLEYLKGWSAVSERIGVVGFCMGGRIALLAATHYRQLAACVDFYGRPLNKELSPRQPEHPLDRLNRVGCPVLGLFGELDDGIPLEQVRKLDAELTQLDKPHRVVTYPAGHAFYNHLSPAYHRESARRAREEMLTFLAAALNS